MIHFSMKVYMKCRVDCHHCMGLARNGIDNRDEKCESDGIHNMRFIINIRSKSSCWRRMNDRKHGIIAASQARAGLVDDDDGFCLALGSEMKMSAIKYDQCRN